MNASIYIRPYIYGPLARRRKESVRRWDTMNHIYTTYIYIRNLFRVIFRIYTVNFIYIRRIYTVVYIRRIYMDNLPYIYTVEVIYIRSKLASIYIRSYIYIRKFFSLLFFVYIRKPYIYIRSQIWLFEIFPYIYTNG